MARRKHIYVRSQRNSSEYWKAYNDRREGPNVRLIDSPRGAAALREVLDQVPRVKADLDAMEAASKRRRALRIVQNWVAYSEQWRRD